MHHLQPEYVFEAIEILVPMQQFVLGRKQKVAIPQSMVLRTVFVTAQIVNPHGRVDNGHCPVYERGQGAIGPSSPPTILSRGGGGWSLEHASPPITGGPLPPRAFLVGAPLHRIARRIKRSSMSMLVRTDIFS